MNRLVELNPDGRSACPEVSGVASLSEAGRPVRPTWLGRYLDRDQKRGEERRIAERVCVHEGSRDGDPLVTVAFPVEQFRPGSFDRPSTGRPLGP